MADDIFDPAFVKTVFDRCSANYRTWSHVASFGFVWIWRQQCVNALGPIPAEGAVGYDLMAGTGEIWPHLLRKHPAIGAIVAVDISAGMVKGAIERLHRLRADRIQIIEANVLAAELDADRADFVICTFGLKTLNPDQQRQLAQQLSRVLKPGGVFSFIEASDPEGWIFGGLFRFYLRTVLPKIERLFLRGAQDFAMLGIYTRAFQNSGHFRDCARELGLDVTYHSYFFGCASGVSGMKPAVQRARAVQPLADPAERS